MPGGVLRFINGSPKTISNVITGAGKMEMNGAAVTLTAADGFKGETSGNGSVSGDGGYVKSGDGVASFTGALERVGWRFGERDICPLCARKEAGA